jgi:L-iditol 2-dehydrogenase
MPAVNCFNLPDAVSLEEGALLEPLGVALHATNLSHLKPGDTVAVLGAGPIGLLIAAAVKIAGASTVYMTDPIDYRRNFARRYAADVVIDPERQDAVSEILHLTEGRGVDVVFEAAGAAETPQQAAEIVRSGGKVILAGIPTDDKLTFTASVVRRKGLTIKLVRRMKHTYPRAIQLAQSGRVDLKPLITHRLPLSQVAEAMELLTRYRDGVIKIVIEAG